MDVINIDRGWYTASILVEMLSKAWPEWTFDNSTTYYHPSEHCFWLSYGWTPLKIPYGFISHKLQNRLPMDGEGDEPQLKMNCQFLLVYFEDCFRAKFGARAFHFRQLFRVPFIIWKVLLFYFYLYSSFFRIWRVSDFQICDGSLCKQRVYLLSLLQFLTDCTRPC